MSDFGAELDKSSSELELDFVFLRKPESLLLWLVAKSVINGTIVCS
jgi:hypothetical protein